MNTTVRPDCMRLPQCRQRVVSTDNGSCRADALNDFRRIGGDGISATRSAVLANVPGAKLPQPSALMRELEFAARRAPATSSVTHSPGFLLTASSLCANSRCPG